MAKIKLTFLFLFHVRLFYLLFPPVVKEGHPARVGPRVEASRARAGEQGREEVAFHGFLFLLD